jgi:hypothetical protein
MTTVLEHFTPSWSDRWTKTTIGSGSLTVIDERLRMSLTATPAGTYADAQIDDYGDLPRARFPWRPPLRMTVRARSSLPAAADQRESDLAHLAGTAGFGFWNYPFSVRGDALMLPEAVWFFYASPPSDMALVPGQAGWGWKAQVVHAMRPAALLATVPTALSVGWGRLTNNTRPAARWVQRLSGAHEQPLAVDLCTWHTYVLEWHMTEANFWVDGMHVLRAPHPPKRPLGFVAWLDNQYAIATPHGQLRFGAVPCAEQWFELDSIQIDPLTDPPLT